MTATSVDPMLFASLDPPRLAGSRCKTCGTVTFPVQTGCAKCTGADLERIELPDRGTLWTWTVQAFEPKSPYRSPVAGFEPYGVGYVDLGEVIIESRLTGDPARLEIGTPMRLTVLSVWQADDGADVVTYAFEPEAGEQ
ncbi:MAG TPA: OB-fold domain-containing protein [Jatrophihabitans sp.]|nr:OB-fold domain-containing protein [Jatrophihabitans sp.]